ncbi:MAG: ABC transporter ATP-binding protein, partial [Candidatus Omnitrophica bacterium]|nr:ABC transporter ATP-binding protein [Candidatus Omnitrophota bacterium]
MDPLLELKNVKKYFPVKTGFFRSSVKTAKVVDGISLKINESKTLGLVGESGCGKSTLAKLILALFEPTNGEIFFNKVRLERI